MNKITSGRRSALVSAPDPPTTVQSLCHAAETREACQSDRTPCQLRGLRWHSLRDKLSVRRGNLRMLRTACFLDVARK